MEQQQKSLEARVADAIQLLEQLQDETKSSEEGLEVFVALALTSFKMLELMLLRRKLYRKADTNGKRVDL